VIQDLSNTLKAILTQPGLPADLAAAAIVFDRPADAFAPTQTTVDLFLYDIRENLELRNYQSTVAVSDGVAKFTPPPLRVACSYLVTAWPVGGTNVALQEQQLLAEVLQLLAGIPVIPANFLQGSLVGQQPALPVVTLHPEALRSLSEFWTALGAKLRPSLTVTVTIAMNVLPVPAPAPIVITGEFGFEQLNLPSTHEAVYQIAGTVTNAASAPVSGASVTVIERGLVAATDSKGTFNIGPLAAGTYTLQVQAGAAQKSSSITVPATTGKNYNVQLS
jgi:hypothetical protein